MNTFIQSQSEMFSVANHHYLCKVTSMSNIDILPTIDKLKFTIIKTRYESMFQNNGNIFDGHIYIRVRLAFRNVRKERECIS